MKFKTIMDIFGAVSYGIGLSIIFLFIILLLGKALEEYNLYIIDNLSFLIIIGCFGFYYYGVRKYDLLISANENFLGARK